MTPDAGGPPRGARTLLDWLLRAEDAALTGDLDEEYARFVRPARGKRQAAVWYWRQVLLTMPRLVRRRISTSGGGWSSLSADAQLALRLLRRRPRYVLAIVGTLALALGANTTVFTVVHSVLLRPLPYHQPERLVRPVPDELFFLNSREAQRLSSASATLESVAAWARTLFLFTDGDAAEEVRGAMVAWNHFDVLGAQPHIGRTFARDDAERQDAILLSHGLWVRRFGSDPDIIGKPLDLYGRSVNVVGVMGAGHVPIEFDWEAWRPMPLDPEATAGMGMAATGRLRPGVTMVEAEADLRRALTAVWSESGDVITPEDAADIRVIGLDAWLFGDARSTAVVLVVAVGLVLLLACANVASLVITEGGRRRRELAVRSALGGSRARLARQLFLEVLVLTAAGGLFGLIGSIVSQEWFAARLPQDIPRVGEIQMGGTAFAFTSVVTLFAAFLTGVVPALRAANSSTSALATGSTVVVGLGPKGARFRAGLVAAETAIALALLVSTGILARSFVSLRLADPGFDAAGVITVRTSPPSSRYPDGADLAAYYGSTDDRARAHASRHHGRWNPVPPHDARWLVDIRRAGGT